jgi:hypothetical protein
VLAADIPVFREVGATGAAYAPPDDAGAWAAAIAQLSTDGVARSALVEAGHARAVELTYDRTAAGTVTALRELVSAPIAVSQQPATNRHATPPAAPAASVKATASLDVNA